MAVSLPGDETWSGRGEAVRDGHGLAVKPDDWCIIAAAAERRSNRLDDRGRFMMISFCYS